MSDPALKSLRPGKANPVAQDADTSKTFVTTLMTLLNMFAPGLVGYVRILEDTFHINLSLSISVLLVGAAAISCWDYVKNYLWTLIQDWCMSIVEVRPADEIYNSLMRWVIVHKFSKGACKFVVHSNRASSYSYLWDWNEDKDSKRDGKKNTLRYSPSLGTHWFWYRRNFIIFRRSNNKDNTKSSSKRDEVSLLCFGRNPRVLKELLREAYNEYMGRDQRITWIYRAKASVDELFWTMAMSRVTRPFSTVILSEGTKKNLVDDITNYLNPLTQNWYANRGIPYRRGYLLYGPPGTGKSSLSFALAGHFEMRIYIVSLNSENITEEALVELFNELPSHCVVLLEDIDTAGLSQCREGDDISSDSDNDVVRIRKAGGAKKRRGVAKKKRGVAQSNAGRGRLSLSGLLNILDGVGSQEGRVLIMTTNHIEKLDKALIRPGRIDMVVKFELADKAMSASMFRNIFATLDGEIAPNRNLKGVVPSEQERKTAVENEAKEQEKEEARIDELAEAFAAKVPEHEFSPAELQGHLLEHKENAERAVATVEEFVKKTRKRHKVKDIQDAEKKRKAEKEKNDAQKETQGQEENEQAVDDTEKTPELNDVNENDTAGQTDASSYVETTAAVNGDTSSTDPEVGSGTNGEIDTDSVAGDEGRVNN